MHVCINWPGAEREGWSRETTAIFFWTSVLEKRVRSVGIPSERERERRTREREDNKSYRNTETESMSPNARQMKVWILMPCEEADLFFGCASRCAGFHSVGILVQRRWASGCRVSRRLTRPLVIARDAVGVLRCTSAWCFWRSIFRCPLWQCIGWHRNREGVYGAYSLLLLFMLCLRLTWTCRQAGVAALSRLAVFCR